MMPANISEFVTTHSVDLGDNPTWFKITFETKSGVKVEIEAGRFNPDHAGAFVNAAAAAIYAIAHDSQCTFEEMHRAIESVVLAAGRKCRSEVAV
jgi:hypothetical protein